MRNPRHRTRSGGAACAALLAVALLAPAAAVAEPTPLAPAGTGLSAPPAVVQTPDGGVWVADEVRGVCRVMPGTPALLVDSRWCGAGASRGGGREIERESGPTEQGAHDGPKSASDLAFDPATSHFYVSDRHSSGGGIWRLHFDPVSGAIDRGAPLRYFSERVERLTLAPAPVAGAAPDLLYVTEPGGDVMRLPADQVGVTGAPAVAVSLDGDHVFDMAVHDDALFLADDGGVTRHPLSAGDPERLDGFSSANLTAIAIDAARGRLYAGTSNPDLDDRVDVLELSTGRAEVYAQDFSGVTALGVQADGGLIVADDVEWALGAQGTVGEGRLWSVALEPLGRPAARIVAAPEPISAAAGASFSYAARDGATFECALDAEPYAACPGDGTGVQEYDALAEGRHVFRVRAVEGPAGPAAKHVFVLDRTAPTVTVMAPTGDFTDWGPAPRIHFAVDEAGVSFRCSLDGGPWTACWSGGSLDGLSGGERTLRVVGTDPAGNVSETTTVTLSIRTRVLPGAPALADPAVQVVTAPALVAPPEMVPASAPVLHRFSLRLRERHSGRAASLRLRVRTGPAAGSVRLTIRKLGGRIRLARTVVVRPDARHRFTLALSRADRRRLAPGRYVATALVRSPQGAPGAPLTARLQVRP